jgi:flagellar protein FlbD
MIRLTRLNHQPFVLNSDRIEHVETTPDTVVVMDNGQRFVVRETVDELIARVVDFRRQLGLPSVGQPSEVNLTDVATR